MLMRILTEGAINRCLSEVGGVKSGWLIEVFSQQVAQEVCEMAEEVVICYSAAERCLCWSQSKPGSVLV